MSDKGGPDDIRRSAVRGMVYGFGPALAFWVAFGLLTWFVFAL
ncbi:hypothetical protein KHO57_gp186 [Mycobacterium phage Phabba]|uniref:Uncharacterized protein n=1 Tax=Mycobacterium phage Phabba TaxID=2027899 RepID=A0A249XSM2_9CAUD|nr:hypothetical protein KHO57_gp186 [Mycobacterium phage Phabba]ASZ74718.1 hypothetical protein SEA_PHABBA_149 [Mycobacterium phage Phabba]